MKAPENTGKASQTLMARSVTSARSYISRQLIVVTALP